METAYDDDEPRVSRLAPARPRAASAADLTQRSLMLGAFCQVQTGARHDHDWTNDTAGTWFWRPTSNRPESILILGATPRSTVFLRHGACIPPGGSLTA